MNEHSRTIRQVLSETITQLDQARVDSPNATARSLMARIVRRQREWLAAHDDAVLDAEAMAQLNELVARVRAHEPLAYILGKREFYGIDLMVDARVLIPRPETELLVELALSRLSAITAKERNSRITDVVDVGTGSGAIAIAISTHAPGARVIATDISPDALDLARANALRCGVSAQIQFIESDLLDKVTVPAHVVVANLPYVTSEEIDILPPEIQAHEPRIALDGGADGLDRVRQLLGQLAAHLVPGGAAFMEIGAFQSQAALQATRAQLPQALVELQQDLAGLDRALCVYLRPPSDL